MFWKYNNASSSQIEAVLAKEDVTLQELMDEEDIINECKLQNKTLMDFLTRPEIIEELVTLTTVEPSAELDERMRFKYSNIACEILTCDVPALNEKLASDENLLSKLYVFLDSEPPLNPLLASFFSKIMGVLIAKKTEQVLDFLKAKENFVSILLKHLGTSAIMDLTLKLMTQVEGVEVRQNILNWLDSQQIMQTLVSLLDPSVDKERHDNVAQLLCDFIKISRDNQRNSTTERSDPDPLLNTLESPETVSLLLDHMLGENKNESCIVGGIQVLLAVLDVNKVSCDEGNDVERRQAIVESTTLAILKRLRDFHALLLDPPKKAPIGTTVGVLDPPLGNTRLQVTRLFAAVISTNNPELMRELISLGTMQVLLDLFFAFPWNNFLHTQVQACITSALKGAHIPSETVNDNALYKHWLDSQQIMQTLVSLLDPSVDKERHDNVAQLLCDFIKISRDNQRNSTTERSDPDPLLNTLESPRTVSLLLDHIMLGENKNESCIVGGIQVLLAVLDINKVRYTEILYACPCRPSNMLHRTSHCRSIVCVNSTKYAGCMGCLPIRRQLFLVNNVYHNMMHSKLNNAMLIVNCKLIERILEAWKDNDVQQSEAKGVRQGYMGHLTNIASSIAELCSTSPLGQFLKDNLPEVAESFTKFSESTLQEVKKTREILLGGAHPNTSNEDSDEYGDIPFPQSTLLHQQMFAQYQVHQLTPQFIESYGFNDDDFNDGDDTLQTIDHRTGMNFDLSEGDLVQQHELFKQVCAQNINTLDDADDQIFEDRDHTFQTVIEKQGERHDAVYSSDSDEDDSPPRSPPSDDPFMDIDPWTSQNRESESATAPVSIEDPWTANEKTASEANMGWANFSSPSFANFEANFEGTENNAVSATCTARPVVETDLKVENIEIDRKTEEVHLNHNIRNESIENVAQIVQEAVEEAHEEIAAAGDQGHVMKTVLPNVDVQPSKSAANTEENSCKLQTGSTVRTIKQEPDQQGI